MNKIRRGNREGSRLFGYLMVVPATLLLVVVSIIPLLDGVYLAFTNTNLNTGADAWVGIQNFVEIFQDSKFYQVFGFTILYSFPVQRRFQSDYSGALGRAPGSGHHHLVLAAERQGGLNQYRAPEYRHDSRTDLFSVRPDSGEGNGYRIRRLEILSVYDDHLAGGHAVHRWCAL